MVAGRTNEVEYVQGTAAGDYSVPDTDLFVGNASDYGLVQVGDAIFGRTSRVTGNLDMDGTVVLVNRTNPNASNILFAMMDRTNSIRFALPKSAVGNATYNPRSMLIAGPAPVDDACVTVGYWQTNSIFHNLACDTSGAGADLGVQNNLEVEGDIFTDSIKGSTDNTNIVMDPHGSGIVTSATALEFGADADVTSKLGRAAIGYMGTADMMSLAHVDHNSVTNAAVLQDNTGRTYIGAATGTGMAFQINNVEKASLDASAIVTQVPVGIGATAPAGHNLQVYETTSGVSEAGFTNSTTGNTATDGLIVGIDATEKAWLYNYENTALGIGTNNTEVIFMTAAGDVGVGVAPPGGQRMQVHALDSGNSSTTYTNTTTGATASNGFFVGIGSAEAAWVYNYENTNLYLGTFSTTRQTITGAGDIGFGIATPSARMELHEPSSAACVLHITNTTTGAGSNGIYFGIDAAEVAYLWNYESTNLVLATANTTAMTIDTSGNISLGTVVTGVTRLDINDNSFRLVSSQSPTSGGTGTAGEIAWDTSYIYVCTASNTWKRVALTGGY
jgi:hypothetical protein